MIIERHGNSAIVEAEQTVFSYEIAETPRDFQERRSESTLDWTHQDFIVGNYKIHPYGDNNDLPSMIRDVVKNNADAPGIMKKKVQLLWGKGPNLYREDIENNELVKNWKSDKTILKWLKSWSYENYIVKASVDFSHLESTFTKIITTRGTRIGQPFIAKLEHINPERVRLASRINDNEVNPTHAIITDWKFNAMSSIDEMRVYALTDITNLSKYPNSVMYSDMYSFCQDYYTIPDIYGTLEWIKRSTAAPLILKAYSKNSLNIKYHIVSPQKFWDDAENRIKDNCTERGIPYEDKMLRDYENQLLQGVSRVLSGEKNGGKYWHTKKSLEVDGTNLIEHGWEIKVIDQKVKEYIEAQLLISNHSSQKISTSIGVHSALGNVGSTGTADSGSEQLYALQNFLLTGIDIPEMVVMKTINLAIEHNFPDSGLKLGFYHSTAKREQDVTPGKRVANANPN